MIPILARVSHLRVCSTSGVRHLNRQSSVTVLPCVDTRRQHLWCQSSTGSSELSRPRSRGCSSEVNAMAIPKRAFREGSTCPPLARDTLRLYSMRFCPFALRTRLVLTYKNISHETVNINLVSKPSWFLEKNPKGLVPVLEYNDKIVYESAICNEYLDEIYPEVKLLPADPYIRARQQMLMDHYSPIARGFYMMAFASTIDEKSRAMNRIRSAMKIMEESLKDDFFGGHTPGMFDFYAYPHLAMWDFIVTHRDKIVSGEDVMGGHVFPRDLVPKLGMWLDKMKREPAVVKNTEKTEDMVRFVQSWLERTHIDYDAGLTSSKL